MASTTVGDRWLITFRGSLCGQRVLNTFCYGIGSQTGTPTISNAADAIHAQVTGGTGLLPKFLACVPSNYVMTEIWYQIIAPGRFGKQLRVPVGAIGSRAVARFANLASVILRRGDLANRSNVSTLHPPIAGGEDDADGGFLSGDLISVLQTLANQVKANMVTTGSVMNLSPVINNGPNIADFSPITNVLVEPTIRVMRRRTVGQGE